MTYSFVTVVPLLVNRSAPDITLHDYASDNWGDVKTVRRYFHFAMKIRATLNYGESITSGDAPWRWCSKWRQLISKWRPLLIELTISLFMIHLYHHCMWPHISTCFKLSIYQLYDVIFYDHSRNAIITVHWSSHRYWWSGDPWLETITCVCCLLMQLDGRWCCCCIIHVRCVCCFNSSAAG